MKHKAGSSILKKHGYFVEQQLKEPMSQNSRFRPLWHSVWSSRRSRHDWLKKDVCWTLQDFAGEIHGQTLRCLHIWIKHVPLVRCGFCSWLDQGSGIDMKTTEAV